ncbi:FMN-binding protein [Dyella tabacisoli]|uniref:FMN-binding protein n=1 Tax=Dyella tabacisoli TaxID=2282381 RepID=A0A369UPD9_9GAMM|nr:FMN-binding protein [Dyella tabacisoli]RDD82401.1 FMN-binding protein [Dyella tabacisoli]
MKSRFLLIPAYALVMSAPVQATVYLSVEQAQALMFPGATFTPAFVTLSSDQMKAIEQASDVNVLSPNLKAWRVSSGGWFIADQVVGKHEFIPFALAIDANGTVKSVEILEYRETYGDQVRNPAWRAQFTGKTHDAPLKLNDDIKNLSGATLSSRHITDGVKRLLTTHALVLAHQHD